MCEEMQVFDIYPIKGSCASGFKWKQELSPEDYTVSNSCEERVCVGIHGQDVLAVRIFFQGSVNPVYESKPFLLCKCAHA